MHHESLKVHSDYVEKLVDVNRPDAQYTFYSQCYAVEFDRMSYSRGLNHDISAQANNSSLVVVLMWMR